MDASLFFQGASIFLGSLLCEKWVTKQDILNVRLSYELWISDGNLA